MNNTKNIPEILNPCPRNAAQTRERILQSAQHLFSRGTYESVGTRDIAALAKVNATLINRYFGSKRQLFIEVVAMEPSSADYGPEMAFKSRLLRAVHEILSGGEETQLTVRLRIILLSALNPQVSDIIADWFKQKRQILIEGLPGEDAAVRADLLFSFLMGLAVTVRLLNNNRAREVNTEFIKNYLDKLMNDLFDEKGPNIL